MPIREPFSWIEIDVDGCALTFGEGACTAALDANRGILRKCYELRNTCRSPSDFEHKPVFRTLRYCQPRSNLPRGMHFYPVMKGSPSETSSTVNIAGSDSALSAFGRRATIKTTLHDFPDHDRYLDPYQAERVSGAAQIDEPGYDTYLRGTHFSRLRARWPFYAGRPYRRCDGYLLPDGSLTDITVRHYIITIISGPGHTDEVVIEGTDVLDLADDSRAQAPRPTNGTLLDDINESATSFTLDPTGEGDRSYPSTGIGRIGTEFVSFTRLGDVVTITERGAAKTTVASHKKGDTFQLVLSFVNARIDTVVATLLLEAGIDPSFLPLADWASEVDRWLSGTPITRHFGTPTGIKALISSLVPLGFSVWWDATTQKIRLKANRPVDGDPIWDLSDYATNLAVTRKDTDTKRLSEVMFYTVQKTPAGSPSSKENYTRAWGAADPSTSEVWSYRTGRIKSYFCPWLDTGADAVVRVAARRLLLRFRTTPITYTLTLDAGDWSHLQLTDVVKLTSRSLQDETGKPSVELFQILQRNDPVAGERVTIVMQSYQFQGRFAYAMANDTPDYLLATPAQRDPAGFFACDPITKLMPDGTPPYEAI